MGCLEPPRSRNTDEVDAAEVPDTFTEDVSPPEDDTGTEVPLDAGTPPPSDTGSTPTPPPPTRDDAGTQGACRSLGHLVYRSRSRVQSAAGTTANSFGAWLPQHTLGTLSYLAAYHGRTVPVTRDVTIRLQDDPLNSSWDTCVDCLLLATNCASDGRSCQRYYLSSTGYARFNAVASSPGQTFRGTFSAVAFREIEFSAGNRSRFLDGGDCLSLEALEFSTTADDGCSQHTACGTCAATNGCGWCQNTQQCTPGNASGPTNGVCSGTQWGWLPDQCSADAGVADAGVRDAGVDSGGLGGAGMGIVETAFNQMGTAPYSTCTTATQCVADTPRCVTVTDRPGGVCALACSRDAECPNGGLCIRYGTVGYCMSPCVSTCPSGLHCVSYASTAGPAARVCAPTGW